jgi:phage terminase large subunit-like protein
MEAHLCFGPGDLRGEPLVLDAEKRAFIWRMYEIFPRGHRQEGARRFKRCGLSLAKGSAKSELGAIVACAELADDAPVRFDGWDKSGRPVGRPVTDPFVVMVAVTEEQSDELAYGAMRAILAESPIADRFDIGLERIMRKGGDGKAVSLAGSPSARDGARTTFSLHDESHWLTSDKHKRAHQVMLNNLSKRKLSDPWALEVTTAYEPGAGSIAEDTMDYARAIHAGKAADSRLFFFHRQASDDHDLETEEGARDAVIEASGAAAEWRDIDSIVELWRDPTTDRQFWERVWCNRPVQSSRKAFDVEAWRALRRELEVPEGSAIVLGFDGAQFRDSTALVATHIQSGHTWLAGLWERPYNVENWKVPEEEVDACVDGMFSQYAVWRMYADPPYWQSWLSTWQGRYGDERVIEWWTNRRRQMAAALEGFNTSIGEGALSHDGSEDLSRHIGNAYKHEMPYRGDDEAALWLIRKERADSPHKIDAAVAAVLSHEARSDAIASGLLKIGDDEKLPAGKVRYWTKRPGDGANVYILVEGANDKKPSPEHTTIWVVALGADERYYALDFIRDRLTLAERTDKLFEFHREHKPLRVGYTARSLEVDGKHIRERQDQENYNFSITPIENKLSPVECIKRLAPLFAGERIFLPEEHVMSPAFVREEYDPFPLSMHLDMLKTLSGILDVGAVFPEIRKHKTPHVFPSEW